MFVQPGSDRRPVGLVQELNVCTVCVRCMGKGWERRGGAGVPLIITADVCHTYDYSAKKCLFPVTVRKEIV